MFDVFSLNYNAFIIFQHLFLFLIRINNKVSFIKIDDSREKFHECKKMMK